MSGLFCSIFFLTLCMTLDRIYALTNPIKHKKILNRKRKQWVIFGSSITLSFLCTFFVAFFFNDTYWNQNKQIYENRVNAEWAPLVLKLIQLHTWLKIFFAIGLIVASLVLAVVYKRFMKNKAKLNKRTKATDLQKVKTLFWLILTQSVLN